MTRAELDAEFRSILDRHYPGLVPHQRFIGDLVAAASAYTATQIEKTCRTPVYQRGPGRKREARRSA